MRGVPGMHGIELRGFTAGDRDWLVTAHQESYARDHGFDASFGGLVGEILDGFIAGHDADREAGWVATRGVVPLGSIFCMRRQEDVAQLRLFFLDRAARWVGIGRLLLDHCLAFARMAGYAEMQL